MASNNSCRFFGRLTRDVEVQKAQNGTVYGYSSIAVDRIFKKDGEPEADFMNITIIGKRTETFAQYVKKGDYVLIDTHAQNKPVEKNGIKYTVTNYIIDDFSLCPNGRRNGNQNQQGAQNGQNTQNGYSRQYGNGNTGTPQNTPNYPNGNNHSQGMGYQNGFASPQGGEYANNTIPQSSGNGTPVYSQTATQSQPSNSFGINDEDLPWNV